ncbi:MAG TPA: DnaJ domain-containing protein [Alphaproteobacteria bacterium]|nr:DnaJ domain-containing protein [Alphaproteobacteria bacterium]
MLAYLLLGTAFLMSLLLLARWAAAADPGALVKGVRYGGGAAAAGLALYLVVSGRWPLAIAAVSSVLPFVLRWRAVWNRAKAAAGPRPGQRSEVVTAMLRMTLDHDSGAMTGSVLAGTAAGRELESLTRAELASLLAECESRDPPSVPLLESYLERRFGADWREEAEAGRAGGSGDGERSSARGRPRSSNFMSREEALQILGLAEGVDSEEIKEAYRRLMLKLHPDHGGSGYLAAKLNQAKDVLLGG